jgi:hypothetical protein
MKIFEMKLGNEDDGVFAISLVDAPAINEMFVLLSENGKTILKTLQLKASDKEKKLVSGPILIPEQQILRKDEKTGEEYMIYFTAETIEKISQNYLINNHQNSSTIQHEKPVESIFMVESWIVGKNDKSKDLGFDLPEGTWFGTLKVQDENLWDTFLKTGILKGFSIEGNFNSVLVDDVDLNTMTEYAPTDEDLYRILHSYWFSKTDLAVNKYRWVLSGEVESCPICIENSKRAPMTMAEWNNIGVPGLKGPWPYGPYSTYCEDKCRCRLEKVTDITDIIPSWIPKKKTVIPKTKKKVAPIVPDEEPQ